MGKKEIFRKYDKIKYIHFELHVVLNGKIKKMPSCTVIDDEKSSKDMANSDKLVSTIES